MAVVYRFPDRIAAETEQSRPRAGALRDAGRTGEVLILPCIRRERIDPRQAAPQDMPAQLQA